MEKSFIEYIVNLYKDVPIEIYEGLISVFCIGAVGNVAFFGWKHGRRKVAGLLLAEYVFLIYCSTVLCRKATEEIACHNFSPFWSYEAIRNGQDNLIVEDIMNLAAFIPLGILLGLMMNGARFTINRALFIALVGCGLSISIESLQFFFHRGFAETDDVMHNTLGCMIGYGFLQFCVSIMKKIGRYEFR